MPGALAAGIAGSIGSAAIQSRSAKKAGEAQSAAADAQIAETRRQFDLVQGLLKPYVDSGNVGLQAQLDLMGLGGQAAKTMGITEIPGIAGSAGMPGYWKSNGNERRGPEWFAGSPSVSAVPGGFQVDGQMFPTRAEAEAYANANATPGVTAAQAQQSAIGALESGPQFQNLVKQGEYGMLANTAATGGLRGGNTQAAMAQFRPAMLQALIDKQLANYGGIAANGQNAAAMTGTAAQNAGAQVNQALGDRGAAQAGAALAGGQAWGNAGAGILNTVGQMAQPTTPGGGAWQKWTF